MVKPFKPSDYERLRNLKRLIEEEEDVIASRYHISPMSGGPCGTWYDRVVWWVKTKLHI